MIDHASEMAAFVRVVESNGFSAAAPALGLTPSAVSKLVTRLETRLGVRLLQRTTRALHLTEEGEAFYATARRIVGEIEALATVPLPPLAVPRRSRWWTFGAASRSTRSGSSATRCTAGSSPASAAWWRCKNLTQASGPSWDTCGPSPLGGVNPAASCTG
mgnify:CR=1 FL=1